MANRAADWLKQAQRDYQHAIDSHKRQDYEWACFAAQQAAEKAAKALHLSIGQEVWGHVIAKILRELPAEISVPTGLIDKAMVLDNFYIPPRYPDSHPEGAPFEHYGELQSKEAIAYAGEIITFVRSKMAGSTGSA